MHARVHACRALIASHKAEKRGQRYAKIQVPRSKNKRQRSRAFSARARAHNSAIVSCGGTTMGRYRCLPLRYRYRSGARDRYGPHSVLPVAAAIPIQTEELRGSLLSPCVREGKGIVDHDLGFGPRGTSSVVVLSYRCVSFAWKYVRNADARALAAHIPRDCIGQCNLSLSAMTTHVGLLIPRYEK